MAQRTRRFQARRGAILVVVIVTALLSAVAVYTIMLMTLSQARQATFFQDRAAAVNAAEGAIVWAQQKLMADETFCAGPGNDPPSAMFTPPTTVDVTIAPCGAGTTNPRVITAKVTY